MAIAPFAFDMAAACFFAQAEYAAGSAVLTVIKFITGSAWLAAHATSTNEATMFFIRFIISLPFRFTRQVARARDRYWNAID